MDFEERMKQVKEFVELRDKQRNLEMSALEAQISCVKDKIRAMKDDVKAVLALYDYCVSHDIQLSRYYRTDFIALSINNQFPVTAILGKRSELSIRLSIDDEKDNFIIETFGFPMDAPTVESCKRRLEFFSNFYSALAGFVAKFYKELDKLMKEGA